MWINIDSETEGVNFILQTTVMCHHRTVGHIMDMRPAPCANQTKCAKEKHLLSLSRGKMFVLVALNESCSPAKFPFVHARNSVRDTGGRFPAAFCFNLYKLWDVLGVRRLNKSRVLILQLQLWNNSCKQILLTEAS